MLAMALHLMLGVALAGASGPCLTSTCASSGTGADDDVVPLLQVKQQGDVGTGRNTAGVEFPIAVYVFWDTVNHQHTLHFPPAWKNEVQDNVQFYAYGNPHCGMEPVRVFWDEVNKQHTFHLDGPWKNEKQGNILYYVSRTQKPGMVSISAFWDTVNKQHTFHPYGPWKNEVQDTVQFWAYPSRPDTADPIECMPDCPAYPSPDFATGPLEIGELPIMGGSMVAISGFYNTVYGSVHAECAMKNNTLYVWCQRDTVDQPSKYFRLIDAGAKDDPSVPGSHPHRYFALQASNGLYCTLGKQDPIGVKCNSTAIGRAEMFEMKAEPFPVITLLPFGDAVACFIDAQRLRCFGHMLPRAVTMKCTGRCGKKCGNLLAECGAAWGNGEDCEKLGFAAKDGCSKQGWTCEAERAGPSGGFPLEIGSRIGAFRGQQAPRPVL